MLQPGKGDAGHQCVPVQTRPGPPFEVAQAQLLLELLVCLLADPTPLDGRGEGAQRRAARQVAEVVLALAARTLLAHKPDLLAGEVA